PARAVLAANLETAVNGVWDAGVHVGGRVTIVGAGTVGGLVPYLAGRMPHCEGELIDVNASRAAGPDAFGGRLPARPAPGRHPDVVIHAGGSPSGLECALAIAGFEATIVEMSWYGDRAVGVPLGEAFHARRLTIKSSQVGSVAASQRARWTSRRRMQLALAMLDDPALDVLITGESAFDDLPEVMARLASTPSDTICHRVRYS